MSLLETLNDSASGPSAGKYMLLAIAPRKVIEVHVRMQNIFFLSEKIVCALNGGSSTSGLGVAFSSLLADIFNQSKRAKENLGLLRTESNIEAIIS